MSCGEPSNQSHDQSKVEIWMFFLYCQMLWFESSSCQRVALSLKRISISSLKKNGIGKQLHITSEDWFLATVIDSMIVYDQ